ncbi:PD40 domain-containing protein [Hyunsoonleella aestuarii]|uniref:Uncharacterized protein n=1 Tax=Hyunsoonleella aestuarii TaxID=912802 RepID=A0ABP8EBX8_9FLAO|nr:PD40 domain-containing protein [Hyunsoonleella aestuarii]
MIKSVSHILFLLGYLLFSQSSDYSITNLKINNEHPHFGLMKHSTNKIIFTSYLLGKKGKVRLVSGNPILTIYEGVISSSGEIEAVEAVKIDDTQIIPAITSAAISPDGSKLYLTTIYSKKNKPKGDFKATNFHIEVGEYHEEVGWTNFKVLPFCKPKYSYAHPMVSGDGKTLYFTANLRGGKESTKGGSDIFKVDILDNKTFSEPKNLGSKVNSYSREMFPYIGDDNVLYFASNRPNGFGGFDIYKSKMNDDGTFSKTEKLPKPLNSNKDDFSLIMMGDSGYFSSKRAGGKGDDDIYFFKAN